VGVGYFFNPTVQFKTTVSSYDLLRQVALGQDQRYQREWTFQ
jgi:hypothetical protein